MCDSVDHWPNTFSKHFMEDLKLLLMPIDNAVFVPKGGSYLVVLGLLVDDFIGCGKGEFYKLADATGRQLEVKLKMFLKFELVEIIVEKTGYRYLAKQALYQMN